MSLTFPRVVIAGMAGDSGKTLVSLSILSELHRLGVKTAVFKKGPDFIDAAWLGFASRSTARNLDIYMNGPDFVIRSFIDHAAVDGISLIEGNRGLYDGMETGANSTAELAKLLNAPVILVHSPVKVTRTAAAHVLGCLNFDPDVQIVGVILNKIAGKRHERVVKTAIEDTCGIPVVGVLPKLRNNNVLPDRHLGLVTPEETEATAEKIENFSSYCREYIDLDAVISISRAAPPLETPAQIGAQSAQKPTVRVGFFADQAFTFYYPENLEALEQAGAELIRISPLHDTALPDVDALYIGGGFPETHAELLENNGEFRAAVKQTAESGLPVYAECGGLMYLTESLTWQGRTYAMAGVLPLTVGVSEKPYGHGYCEIEIDTENPFFSKGNLYRGHEFHYSRIKSGMEKVDSVYAVKRGVGCADKRDGILYKNVLAAYTHLHAGGNAQWAEDIVKAAVKFKSRI